MIQQPHDTTHGTWALRDLGRSDEFAAVLEPSRRRMHTLWQEAAHQISVGELAGAAETFAEIGSVSDEAYARLRAAEDLVRAGNRPEADRQLRLALPVFARLGAAAWIADGEALLAASA